MQQQRERSRTTSAGLWPAKCGATTSFVRLFASDASIYEIKPLGVVRPRSTADVAACVRYAAEKHIPDPRPRRGHRRGGRIARGRG